MAHVDQTTVALAAQHAVSEHDDDALGGEDDALGGEDDGLTKPAPPHAAAATAPQQARSYAFGDEAELAPMAVSITLPADADLADPSALRVSISIAAPTPQ